MKKEYEKPIGEIISFEPAEDILTNDDVNLGNGPSGWEGGDEDW